MLTVSFLQHFFYQLGIMADFNSLQAGLLLLLWIGSFDVTALRDKECYKPNTAVINTTLSEQLNGIWYEQQRTSSTFENDTCGNVTFNFVENFIFQFKIYDEKWFVGDGFKEEDGSMSLHIADKSYTSYLIVDPKFQGLAIMYACCGDYSPDYADEQVWILRRSPNDRQLDWTDNELLQQHPRLVELLHNSTVCNDTETPAPTTSPSDNMTSGKTTVGDGSTTTRVPDPPKKLRGFQIPNSNYTFYFVAQFKPNSPL